jgi:esterase/lipase superfamily enzyme
VASFDDRAIQPLLAALNDNELVEQAGDALRERGNALLPTLVASFEDNVKFTGNARAALGIVIEDLFFGMGGGGVGESWEGGHALVKRPEVEVVEMVASGRAGAARPKLSEMAEILPRYEPVEDSSEAKGDVAESPFAPKESFAPKEYSREGYKTVDVFYGTNRKALDREPAATAGSSRSLPLAALGALLLVVVYLVGMYRRGARQLATTGLAVTTTVMLFGLLAFVPSALRQSDSRLGPVYGGGRSNRVEMGVCQVTIPDVHQAGELEAPTLFRLEVQEDLQKHIVLRSVRRLESDLFFSRLDDELQSQGNNILVFVHGYNVSFEDAARRTAQIASDLKFAGAPVFYSWPSQADWWMYRTDEKNVKLSVDPLKKFLLDIAQRSGADTINLVAHSMGNRALTAALKEIDVVATEQEQLFNQVILAAPDIDADVFKRQIAPAIVTKANHITLYASSKDLALVASRTFHNGDPRAGDAGDDLVVVPGIDTIDVSSGDSSLIGHSYYGDSVSVLRDIEHLLHGNPASSRQFLEQVPYRNDLIYWTFQPTRVARREPR